MNRSPLLTTRVSTALAVLATVLFPFLLPAQVPDTLKHSLPAPPVGVQSGTRLGDRVAVEGVFTVVAVPGVFNGLDGDSESYGYGAVKVFDTTTGALLHVLRNPYLADDEDFGTAVAISGTQAVVGAVGRVYVFDLAGATPTTPVLQLDYPGPASNEYFRSSVGISGTVVVAGYWVENSSATESGSTYVYDLSSATPTTPVAALTNPSATAGDQFGYSVAISGTRVLVGTPGKDVGANESGSAYVYDMGSAMPALPITTLLNPSPGAGDNFGVAVAISGMRVVVGAGLDDAQELDAGNAYIYDLSGPTPTVPMGDVKQPQRRGD